jgi:hypothetical protein
MNPIRNLWTRAEARRDQIIDDALGIDHEHQLLTTHTPDGGHCSYCGGAWPCIPAQALGIRTDHL